MVYTTAKARSSALTVSLGFVLANANDDISWLLGLVGEVVLEDGLGASSVAGLSIESGTGVVGNHAVTATERILHCPPDVVFGCGLDVPDITRIT